MGIELIYYRLPAQERERVTIDQSAWEQFCLRIQTAYRQAFQAAVAELQGPEGTVQDRFAKFSISLAAKRDSRRFSMERDWHIIAYLLTGDAQIDEQHREGDPLHNVIFGGFTSSVTTGYGPVRYYDERLVSESAAALKSADPHRMAQRFDPVRMAELHVYAPAAEGEQDELLGVVEGFIAFFGAAASAGEDVIKFAV